MALGRLYAYVRRKFFFNYTHESLILPNKCPIQRYFKIAFNMNTVYFHNENNDDKLLVQLHFEHEPLKIKKTFSFERKMSETIEKFLDRLTGKIHDLLCKKVSKNCKKDGQPIDLPDIRVDFLLNENSLPPETLFGDIFAKSKFDNLKLRILGNDYRALFNHPMIADLSLPEVFRVGCPVMPKKLLTKCCNENTCQFTWFKKLKQQKVWTECGNGYSYIPNYDDVNHLLQLKCVPKNDDLAGPVCTIESSNVVEEFSNGCEIKDRQKFTSCITPRNEFRVVSYNLLADVYTGTKEAKTMLFNYCDPKIIDFDYRSNLIFLELNGYNADLICLQEVDRKFFKSHLSSFMNSKGFRGIFSEKEGSREGCATYVNTTKFQYLNEFHFVICNELMQNEMLRDLKDKIKDNNKLMERINEMPTVLQIVLLKSLNNAKDLVVLCNTHLYFHPNADHIRLLQGIVAFRIILQKLDEFKNENPDGSFSIIWCGDFNSTPDCGIYKFMTQCSVESNAVDWKSCADEEINDISFYHTLKMNSAYGAPQYTNYTQSFKECLDYIFFQTDRLRLKQVVPFPDEKVLSKEIAIPSSYFPSDHLALVANFEWKS